MNKKEYLMEPLLNPENEENNEFRDIDFTDLFPNEEDVEYAIECWSPFWKT